MGFEIMEQHESPRYPFEIFLSHFEIPPTTIIYDNSCKLHQYTQTMNQLILRTRISLWTDSIGVDILLVAPVATQWTSAQHTQLAA